ncbi:MAG: hypothetical protein L6433_01930 [Actinomycetia bacterium]|nr:hypothetical protein [Actinomycetes bacterium]
MDAVLFTDTPLPKLSKRISKRVGSLFTVSSLVEYVALSDVEDFGKVIYYFVHKDSASSHPFAQAMRDQYPGSVIVLVTDERDKRFLDAYFADSDVTTTPTQVEIDSVFPKRSMASARVPAPLQGKELVDSGLAGEDPSIPRIGVASPYVGGNVSSLFPDAVEVPASDSAAPAAATAPEPVDDGEPDGEIEVFKGGKGHNKRRILNYLAALLERPEPAEVRAEPQPEPDTAGKRPRWYAVALVGAVALAAAAVFVPKITKNTTTTDTPKTLAGDSSENIQAGGENQEPVSYSSWHEGILSTATRSGLLPPPSGEQPVAAEAVAPVDITNAGSPATDNSPAPTPAPAPQPAPTPAAPTVSISGPNEVMRGSSATYRANASGAGPFSYSWGSSTTTMVFTVQGRQSVSVTVTDANGQQASASFAVQVI